jgi:hypothetical protein
MTDTEQRAGDAQRERRQFYRINDRVQLRYERIDDTDSRHARSGDAVGLSTGQLLAELDDELADCINLLWREEPLAARALGLMNRKVSMLASLSLSDGLGETASYLDTVVSLSGCGLGFEAEEALPPGTALRLWLILQPSGLEVTIGGRVVGAEPRESAGERRFWTRVDFDDEALAREELIRHVVQKQGMLVSEQETRRR